MDKRSKMLKIPSFDGDSYVKPESIAALIAVNGSAQISEVGVFQCRAHVVLTGGEVIYATITPSQIDRLSSTCVPRKPEHSGETYHIGQRFVHKDDEYMLCFTGGGKMHMISLSGYSIRDGAEATFDNHQFITKGELLELIDLDSGEWEAL